MLAALSVAGMATSTKHGAINKGYTALSKPMAFTAADSLVGNGGFHVLTSDSLVVLITNKQDYLQYQTITTTLGYCSGAHAVTITAWGKVTSTDSWHNIGSAVSWTSTSSNPGIITSGTTAKNYNYLRITYVASGATQCVAVLTFDIKTTNIFPYAAVTLTGRMTSIGLTSTGATANLNASSNYATNINTGTSTALTTIGNSLGTVAIASSAWGITAAGAATGLTTVAMAGALSGATNVTASGTITAANFTRKTSPAPFDSTGTITAAKMLRSTIKCVSTSAVTMTTPTATAIAALIPNCGQGTSFELTIDNSGSSSAGAVTLALDASIVQPPAEIITGQKTLTLAIGTVGRFYIYFISGTAAKIYRVF